LRYPLKVLPRIIWTAIGVIIITIIIAPLMIITSLFTKGGSPYYLMRMWANLVAKSMGLKFSIQGIEKIVPGTSYIITPNHQSHTDILALLSVIPLRFRWVIKKELLIIPMFGWALGCTGAISLDRSNREESIRKLKEGTSKLGGGWSLIIYPEGTRSPDGLVKSFKKGAFMMAVQSGIPILPVTCNGAFKILPKKTLAIRPGLISVTIGNPIPTEGLSEKDVPELMERTRKEILANFDEDFDPFLKRC
jgi:1-acyl-sn-glycerol-3-phosphate acyltransferase